MNRPTEIRTYLRAECAVFRKTDEAFGGLSNMAPGYPVRVNGVRILTVEALYQACRFPHMPVVQQKIIGQHSPMTAKMVSKPFRKDSRADWDRVRVKVMRWCLRIKLSQQWPKFSQLLLSTGDRSIVEDSRKDEFWGALPKEDGTLVGMNVLGRLLMELRESIKQGAELRRVEPPAIPDFLLFGKPLQVVDFRTDKSRPSAVDVPAAKVSYDEPTLPLFAEVTGLIKTRTTVTAPAIPSGRSHGMIEGLQPYPEYKESGQQWLGRIPTHWSLLPNRALFDEVKDRNHPSEEMLSVTITRGIIQQKALLTDTSKKDSSNLNKAAYKLVQPGDLAYNKMRAWQGAVGASTLRGIISPAYVVMRPRKDCTPWYYHHLCRTPSFSKEAERWSYGITSDMWSLRPEHFKVIYSVQPPPHEQAAIVWFLDHSNRKIDGFIRAKRKLIGLLNEQKQAIIHRAVTRGLDPHAPLKPSGIPWLGDIPEHWEVQPLKSVCSIQSGITLGKDYLGQSVEDYPYLRVANVQAGHAKLDVVKTIRVTKTEAQRSMLRAGDVLMTEGGDPDKLGRGCVWDAQIGNCLHQNHVFAVRPNQKKLNPHFLATLMGMVYARAYFQMTAKQTTNLAATNKTKIGMFKILLPPIAEQKGLLAVVDAETRPITTAIARTEREIALMQEYRTRLTADVVTGKLDVRSAVRNIPTEPVTQDPEPPVASDVDEPEDVPL